MNPYESMPEDKLKQHLFAMANVCKSKSNIGIDLYDLFSLNRPITAEESKKLEDHDKFMAAYQEVASVVNNGDVKEPRTLTDVEKETLNLGLEGVISQIKGLDSEVPLDLALNSEKDILTRISIAKSLQPIVKYYTESLETLKQGLPAAATTSSTDTDKFQATAPTGKYDSLLADLDKLANPSK